MQSSLPVALSAQMAIERRLDTLANNLANIRTVGFRAEEVKFDEMLKPGDGFGAPSVSMASEGKSFISTRNGELTQTGNPLDMAVSGDAYFAFQGANGATVYTRDGRMRINQGGTIETLTGHPLLDAGGAQLQVDPNGGAVTIARDGMITQNGRQLGAVGLFSIPATAKLTRSDTSGVIPDQPAQPALDFSRVGVMQGFVEGSNVNPIMEMTRLIALQRAFENAANLTQTNEHSLGEAIQTLGNPK
ncbi:flagellar basal-body rod protein FlgF [Jiella sp. MQZ9-1]|uniref:Flagellar basal-body rod protein FlgF n=1 Tax=Jiella flava TaxID=2816857 RepID=A0A939FT91_9HYPH|nr:flagellar basal-body rod protein FlgF [Jiella flava]MBO0660960.1 flagellar basal-body rod protein FlgF [Jiella flava]MCD2469608.1 flagellar basal-body rod protein FlgF [Jiella flava]